MSPNANGKASQLNTYEEFIIPEELSDERETQPPNFQLDILTGLRDLSDTFPEVSHTNVKQGTNPNIVSESSGSSGGEGGEDSLSQYSTKTAAPEKTQDLSNIIDEEFNKLDVGRILFNPPSKMKEGVPEIIEVRISKDLSANLTEGLKGRNLTEGLKGRGISQVQNISVSTFMHVSLTGDSFAISSKSEEGQIVTSKGFTEWDWEVTPLKSGPQKLWLTVTAEIRIPGSKEKKQLVVLDKDIDVEINPQGSIENAVAETTKDPKWLIVTLIIPGIAWIYKRWTKSKE